MFDHKSSFLCCSEYIKSNYIVTVGYKAQHFFNGILLDSSESVVIQRASYSRVSSGHKKLYNVVQFII